MNRRRTAFAERKIDLSPIFLQTFRCPSPALPDLWRSGQREHSRQEMQRQRTCEQPDGHVQVLRALWIAVDNVVRRRSQSDPTASLWGFSFRVSFIVSRGTGLPGARGKRTRQIFFLGFWSFPTRPVRLSLLSSQARRFPPYFRNSENVGGTPQEDEPTQHQARCRSPHSNGHVKIQDPTLNRPGMANRTPGAFPRYFRNCENVGEWKEQASTSSEPSGRSRHSFPVHLQALSSGRAVPKV